MFISMLHQLGNSHCLVPQTLKICQLNNDNFSRDTELTEILPHFKWCSYWEINSRVFQACLTILTEMKIWRHGFLLWAYCPPAGELEGKRDLLTRGSILHLKKGQDGRKSEVGREEHMRLKGLLRKAVKLVGGRMKVFVGKVPIGNKTIPLITYGLCLLSLSPLSSSVFWQEPCYSLSNVQISRLSPKGQFKGTR